MIDVGRALKAVNDEADVEMHVVSNGGQVVFHTESIEIATRTIEGTFPAFERVIPSGHATRAMVDTRDLAKAIKLASYFATASANILRLTLQPGKDDAKGLLTITANAAEVGDNKGVVECEITGAGGQIALNVKLVGDALDTITTETVALEIQTATNACVFKPVQFSDGERVVVEGHIALVMPMTIH